MIFSFILPSPRPWVTAVILLSICTVTMLAVQITCGLKYEVNECKNEHIAWTSSYFKYSPWAGFLKFLEESGLLRTKT